MQITNKVLSDLLKTTAADPIFFFKNVLGCNSWGMQDLIARSVFENPKTAVKSCHASGKSYIAARIAIAFLFTYEDSIVVTTAPTFRQVKDILWREMNGAASQSLIPLGGDLQTVKYNIYDNWYAVGVSSDKQDNLQGYHAPSGHILVIGDEAPGISNNVLEVMQALLTSEGARLLLIGNPTSPTGEFFNAFTDNAFTKFSIPAFITPNFTANNINSIQDLKQFQTLEEMAHLKIPSPYLITPQWAWERMQKWGDDSPMFISRVCADFPPESDATLIPLRDIEQCMNFEPTKQDFDAAEGFNTVGIDVARFGGDTTVVTPFGKVAMLGTKWHTGKDIPKTIGLAIHTFEECGFIKERDFFVVDDTGVGGGVTDSLNEQGYNVLAINNGSKSDDDRFINKKAEVYWYLREQIKAKAFKVIDDGEVVNQLTSIEFYYNSAGKIAIVSKEDMKKKGVKSPDFADSLALAIWGRRGGGAYKGTGREEVKRRGNLGGNLFAKRF